MTLAWVVLLFLLGPVLVAELPLAHSFGAGSVGYGVLVACWGGGAIVGSFLGRRLARSTNGRRWCSARRSSAPASGRSPVAPVFGFALAGMAVAGVAEGAVSVAEQGILQRRTPDAVRSRATAATEAAVAVRVRALVPERRLPDRPDRRARRLRCWRPSAAASPPSSWCTRCVPWALPGRSPRPSDERVADLTPITGAGKISRSTVSAEIQSRCKWRLCRWTPFVLSHQTGRSQTRHDPGRYCSGEGRHPHPGGLREAQDHHRGARDREAARGCRADQDGAWSSATSRRTPSTTTPRTSRPCSRPVSPSSRSSCALPAWSTPPTSRPTSSSTWPES